MNLQEALGKLDDGERVRRAAWPPDQMLILVELPTGVRGVVWLFDCEGVPQSEELSLSSQDLVSTDWSVV